MKKCYQCSNNAQLFSSYELKKHNKEIHGRIANQQCNYCGNFIGKRRRKRHLRFCRTATWPKLEIKLAKESIDKCFESYLKNQTEQFGSNDEKKEQSKCVPENSFQIPKRKFKMSSTPPKFRYPGLRKPGSNKKISVINLF